MRKFLSLLGFAFLSGAFAFLFYLTAMEYGYLRFEQGAKVGYMECMQRKNPTYKTSWAIEDTRPREDSTIRYRD